ncbi:MAG TPA: endolytic transglycosylase MltG [Anaerolineales bacterium]|nr:endolytic transglycosylase MltG [Anaerolineales bacterium]
MKRKIGVFSFILIILLIISIAASVIYIPVLASNYYGSPSNDLRLVQRFKYSLDLLMNGKSLSIATGNPSTEIKFEIAEGDSVSEIADRLQEEGLITDSHIFQVYLIWTGLDTSVQAGKYKLSNSMNAIQIARELQDSTPDEITFNVLAGWRMEEIAASLPTSGLDITPVEFIQSVKDLVITLDYLPSDSSGEGFLFPGSYLLPRDATSDDLLSVLIQNASLYISPELIQQFQLQGLDVYQAVTLASIVEREAIISSEKSMIASVFLNRLDLGMKLDSDPTVQYALGYDAMGKTWWKNPLSSSDLAIDSPYNTYLYPGIPPGPISNPDLTSLQAIGYPAQSTYLYFRAKCDGSGLHSFAETYEQHLANACQ